MGILATPLGYFMELIYRIVPSYGWTLILFTVIAKVLMYPLSVKQQKSTARMSAFQPMIQEIQKKYANDKERQQQEMMKFQQESGFSMTAGCAPMIINMLVIFGLIEVIYRPMRYILRIPQEMINNALALTDINGASAAAQSALINAVKANPSAFTEVLGDKLGEVQNFNSMFLGMDLFQMPEFGFNFAILLPILAVVTMILSQVITMKMTGQEMQGAMKWMPWMMSVMFGYFCFTVPVGFSLYYTVSNILIFVQSMVLRKKYDPEKIKLEVAAELEAKKAERKQKKQVTIKNEDGTEVHKKVSEAELARIRLARARELDAQRYED